tara:strand:- start:4324 stop:4956 length:633 start_codon:yes stop_codon:yes gene_type:complete
MFPNIIQYIITALKYESEPIIKHFSLSKDPNFNFPVFTSDSIRLVIVGVGKRNLEHRIMKTYLSKKKYKEEAQFINIGIAGGNQNMTTIGEEYLVKDIFDEKSKIFFNCDPLIGYPFKRRSLVTVEKPVKDPKNGYKELVDMEASAIFSTCNKLSSECRIAIIKIVSDHMNLKKNRLDCKFVSSLIENKIETINSFLEFLRKDLHKSNDF